MKGCEAAYRPCVRCGLERGSPGPSGQQRAPESSRLEGRRAATWTGLGSCTPVLSAPARGSPTSRRTRDPATVTVPPAGERGGQLCSPGPGRGAGGRHRHRERRSREGKEPGAGHGASCCRRPLPPADSPGLGGASWELALEQGLAAALTGHRADAEGGRGATWPWGCQRQTQPAAHTAVAGTAWAQPGLHGPSRERWLQAVHSGPRGAPAGGRERGTRGCCLVPKLFLAA